MPILVVGGTGDGMGKHLADTLRRQAVEVHAWGLPEVDVTNPASLMAALSSLPQLDGIAFYQRDRAGNDYAVMVEATERIIKYARLDKGCSIVVIGSPAAELVYEQETASYHVAKAALAQLARFYAVKLGSQGIRVNLVYPGSIAKQRAMAWWAEHPEEVQHETATIPLGRLGRESDVTETVIWLLSSGSSFVTGATIPVDGGQSLLSVQSGARRVRYNDAPGGNRSAGPS